MSIALLISYNSTRIDPLASPKQQLLLFLSLSSREREREMREGYSPGHARTVCEESGQRETRPLGFAMVVI